MLKTVAIFILSLLSFSAFAETASVNWYSRGTYVVCGATVDKQTLNVRVSVKDEVLAADTGDGRALIYIDLHKPTQVRWLIIDGMSDADYEKREATLAKLSPEEAEHLRNLSATHTTDLYSGMTGGFVTLDITSKSGRSISLSCQELPIPGAVVME